MSMVVDTCVILDVLEHDPAFGIASAEAIERYADGGLIVSPLTYVELAPAFLGDEARERKFLFEIGVELPPGVGEDDLSIAIGKEPVEVVESPGFIVNRILIPLINEGIGLVETGVATAEDVDNAAGLEGEGEELVEDEVVEEPVEEEVVEEPVEEVVVEEEAPAPVEPAPSPKTGNAPVALAVIPVALAAAAVVAKKRG